MVRLKDIAERAGVSIMTVSKVLRDAPDISVNTKIRIKALSQEMGYVPHAMAAGLRTRATRLLGVVIPGVSNPVYARLVMALEDRAYEHGFELFLAHTLEKPEREELVLRRLLARPGLTGLTVTDLGLVELNEAFAVQALAVIRELGLDEEKTNIHGGAIALGHPLGCSGARITTTLIHALRRRGARYGLATLCVGVGQGAAALFEAL